MYIIVVGAGAIGSQVLDLATQTRNEVVVIERDPQLAEEASQAYDCLVLNADATSKDTLLEAGAEEADAIIATTDTDATNIMVLLLAKEIGVPNLVSVVQEPDHMTIFRQLGANVLENPQRLIAEYLFRAVQRPSVTDFMDLGGEAEIFEVIVPQGAPIVGVPLAEADQKGMLGEDVLVVAIEREGEVLTPKGKTTIEAGDQAIVFSRSGIESEVMELFTGESEA